MEIRNIVNIDFATSYNTSIQCIKVDSTRWGDVYMAVIPGTILGIIFEQYQEDLFENNTSTFYHNKRTGIIEKEIRKTLRQKPDLFFSCNNGLSTIASEVVTVIVDGMLHISRINNWKIINGAITTVAIAASLTNKRVDLNKVFVPLKICVTHNLDEAEFIKHEVYLSSNRQINPPQPDFTRFLCCSDEIPIYDHDERVPNPDIRPKKETCTPRKLKNRKSITCRSSVFLDDKLDSYLRAAEPADEEGFNCCTYSPKVNENRGVSQDTPKSNDKVYDDVYSSVFSPAEVIRKSNMLIQVYLHLREETEKVISLAQEAQRNAERRDYIPLQCKLKRGDKVDISLNIYGETLLQSDKKSIVWFGAFTKCTFSYYVPKDIEDEELRCVAILSVNGAQIGEMCFVTQIVETPRSMNSEVFTRKFNKIFISYAHQDESKVKFIAQAYKAQGVDYFFDRDYLKAGDIFPQKIEDYINSADLFILCWSNNAAKSDYVEKERYQALDRAYPKVKPIEIAPLSIYPLSIEPRAELPEDMKSIYNFELI